MAVPPLSPRAALRHQFTAALDHHRAGRLAEAERGYRYLLRHDPDHADTLHLLGLLALQAGHLDDARQWVSAALARDGSCAAYHASLGEILRVQGRMEPAAMSFRRIAIIEPDRVDGWTALGLALRELAHPAAAATALRRAVALAPDIALAHNNLGLLPGAESCLSFRRAIVCAPDLAEAHANLGTSLAGQARRADALGPLRRALILRPLMAANWYALAAALGETAVAEKRAASRTALVCQPDHGPAHNLAGLLLVQRGDLAGAAGRYRRALACHPDPSFYVNLADVTRFAAGDAEIAALERLAAKAETLDDEARIALHFALGKAHDDCGGGDLAFRHYLAGNALKRRAIAYDEPAALTMMARAARDFPAELLAGAADRGECGEVPIFILGMPRSGSTLIEQILASHPAVHGGDERADFPELLSAFDGRDYRALGAAYLARSRALAPDASRVTDKLPGNFLHAGLIHMALPDARIIHTRRDPADTCVSCFTKLFRGEQAYTYDLGELGRYYRAYARLMAHWRAVLPASVFLEIDYEAVVADPEGETRRLLAHCGLAWDGACLAFHQTRRDVRTASAAQVRRPIYRDSIGRWRRYAALLAPLLSELEEA